MTKSDTPDRSDVPDPVTRLTPVEREIVAKLNANSSRPRVLHRLKRDLQTAVEIELATIPIYLFTYYSLVRNKVMAENIDQNEIFVNKAGGVIMSVAVEEMLHMSLSSNVLFALGEMPKLYLKAPGAYPTGLPYHNPTGPVGPHGQTAVEIPLAKLGYDQLWHFLQIEYPEPYDALPEDRDWDTIGQFYSYIRCLISTDFITDADFRTGAEASQIQPYNYSPNNIDTIHPTEKFDGWKPAPPVPTPSWARSDPHPSAADVADYSNQADSHVGATQLVTVASKRDALIAIDTICDQGEGYAVPRIGPEPVDDPSKKEASHYYKFLKLQAQFEQYKYRRETLPKHPPPPDPVSPTVTEPEIAALVADFPESPVAACYPWELAPVAAFASGLFQYMLIMTETVYKVPPAGQRLFFNEGMHRSMIWVLDKYIQKLRGIRILSGPYEGKALAPTFDNTPLGPRKFSYAGLTAMGIAAVAAAEAAQKLYPEGSPSHTALGGIAYYVNQAVPIPGAGDAARIPDVFEYW